MTGPAQELLDDLRASVRFLALLAAVGAAAGLAGELLRPLRSAASAALLVSAHTPDPDGFRRRPISVAELEAHLDGALLSAAATAAGVPAGSFAVEVSARSESGLYDVTALSRDAAVVQPAATEVARALAGRLSALRTRKAQQQLDLEGHAARLGEREKAASAYLQDVASGEVEAAVAPAGRAAALSRRESLRLALDRAEARLQAEEQALARSRASALALEPAAEVFAAAGAPVMGERHLLRGGITGAAAGLFLSISLVLLLGRPRRDRVREIPPPARMAAS